VARRVIVGTGVLIAFERRTLDIDTVLGVDDGAVAAITAITAMELLVGVEHADAARRAPRVWRPRCPACR
jgi:tRNA(fMet)-specific endonuclease VapC